MTPAQRDVAARIAGSRGGDGARGPFGLWLRVPELADRLQRVGAFVRYETALPSRLIELAICVCAAAWRSAYEWHAHAVLAVEAGLDPAILAALRDGRDAEDAPAEEAAVIAFCTELHRDRAVSDGTFARALDLFGEAGVTELVATSGYYVAVSMSLNVAQVKLPPGAEAFAMPAQRRHDP